MLEDESINCRSSTCWVKMQVWGQSRITMDNRKGLECPHLGSLLQFPLPPHHSAFFKWTVSKHLKEYQIINSFRVTQSMVYFPRILDVSVQVLAKSKSIHIKVHSLKRSAPPMQAVNWNQKVASSSSSIWNFLFLSPYLPVYTCPDPAQMYFLQIGFIWN